MQETGAEAVSRVCPLTKYGQQKQISQRKLLSADVVPLPIGEVALQQVERRRDEGHFMRNQHLVTGMGMLNFTHRIHTSMRSDKCERVNVWFCCQRAPMSRVLPTASDRSFLHDGSEGGRDSTLL